MIIIIIIIIIMYRSDVLECGMCCVRLANFAYYANLHLHVIEFVYVLSKYPAFANAGACLHGVLYAYTALTLCSLSCGLLLRRSAFVFA